MKRNLILLTFTLLSLTVLGQGSLQQRAASRKAGLKGSQVAAVEVSPSAVQAAAGRPSAASSVIRPEWVEFLAPQAVTLSELYNVAGGFARGSYEFCEVLALSGRLFPTDAIACINAAGVALIRGDAATAHHYLERLMSDQRAFNNIGLMYILEGNRDKAEVYLQLAAANGSCPGAPALK